MNQIIICNEHIDSWGIFLSREFGVVGIYKKIGGKANGKWITRVKIFKVQSKSRIIGKLFLYNALTGGYASVDEEYRTSERF